MKKTIGFLFCAALMLVACNEANVEKKAAPEAQPAAAAPAPAPAPAQAQAPEAPKSQIKNVDWAKALEMQQAGALLIERSGRRYGSGCHQYPAPGSRTASCRVPEGQGPSDFLPQWQTQLGRDEYPYAERVRTRV